jgi:hypothetical protein
MMPSVIRRVTLGILAALAGLAAGPASAQPPPITLQLVASGLSNPVGIVNAGDGSGRLFIVLQDGRIVIFDGTQVRPVPFLDIRSIVLDGGEQGLLGLAFHPSYATNGFFFVYHTDNNGDIAIARYQVSADPNVANPASRLPLLGIPHPGQDNHNGGQLQFGPDGKLYAAVGDGGGSGDPNNNSQNLGSLLGKILRLDVDVGPPWLPAGNPFGTYVWHFGVRNPWRFTFDRLTGDMFIGDVGQNLYEEIDFQPAGQGGLNFGWRRMEGLHCFNPSSNCNTGGLTLPILEYGHTGGNQSVAGGYRYRGTQVAGLQGTYLYADTYSGRIWGATEQPPGGVWTSVELLNTSHFISTFGEDEAGELYLAHLSSPNGAIYRIVGTTPPLFTGGVFVAAGDLDGDGRAEILTGPGPGRVADIRAFDADGTGRFSFAAYDPAFQGGVRLAACDFDGDGRADVLSVAGPGGAPHVRILKFSPQGAFLADLASFFAYDPGFTGGLFAACGDLDGDTVPEILLGVDAGGGPHVRTFKYTPGSPGNVTAFVDFFAYDPGFRGGIRVATGNVDASDRASVITGAGPGGGPHVRVLRWDGAAFVELASFLVYDPGFRNGIFVAAGDLAGDARAEILTAADAGGGPHLRVWTGAGADTGVSFFAYAPAFLGGVRVAVGDVDGTGFAEILTAAGPGGGPHVGVFSSSGTPLGPGFLAY